MANIQLLIIDPQNDFCTPYGALYVPGSVDDVINLTDMICLLENEIEKIYVTLDAHHPVDIAHAIWFKNEAGEHPKPFTEITATDLKNNTWKTSIPELQNYTLYYLETLEKNGRYKHIIWPEHCLIGTKGANIVPQLSSAINIWATNTFRTAAYLSKGNNPHTEHFSAIRAEVPDTQDPTTQLNIELVQNLERANTILIAGEAGSHCVANTCIDLANNFFNPKSVEKMTLLTNTISPVPGFELLQEKFINDLVGRGMKTTTTHEFLTKMEKL
jgi:nicotinamidase-related amidase